MKLEDINELNRLVDEANEPGPTFDGEWWYDADGRPISGPGEDDE